MAVVTNLSLPGSAFELGRAFRCHPDVKVTVDEMVPLGGAAFPYVWVSTHDHEQFRHRFEQESVVEELQLVQRRDDEALYRTSLVLDEDEFVQCLEDCSVSILQVTGTQDQWEFELRFDTHDDVREFQRICRDKQISISFDRVVSGSAGKAGEALLSPRQRETIELALERGYFEVPRRTSMVELAEELGVSDQAVSARIRRAMKTLGEVAVGRSDWQYSQRPSIAGFR